MIMKRRLKFEYCECGCKCYVASAGRLTFHIFNDLRGGFWLRERPLEQPGTRYTSYEAAKDAAEGIVRQEVLKIREALR